MEESEELMRFSRGIAENEELCLKLDERRCHFHKRIGEAVVREIADAAIARLDGRTGFARCYSGRSRHYSRKTASEGKPTKGGHK